MDYVIKKTDLPGNEIARSFEGYLHHAVNLSIYINDTPPGDGTALHSHPYEEVFVIRSGQLTFTVGDQTIEVSGENVVVVPAGVPHKFINSGTETAHHIDIHANAQMVNTWL
jgi:mannose-6-phosphate isomerase-like protein (cupin superfamily)